MKAWTAETWLSLGFQSLEPGFPVHVDLQGMLVQCPASETDGDIGDLAMEL